MTPTSFRRFVLLPTASGISLAALAFPALAQAQEVDGGVYVTGRIGVALPSDFDLEGVQAPVAPSPGVAGAPAVVEAELGTDITFSGAIGYKIPKRFFGVIQPNIELEYTYTDLDVTGGSFNGGNQTFLGDTEVQTFTINYQGDIILAEDQLVTPFFGSGIGIGDVDNNIQYFPATASAPTFGVVTDDTGLVLQSNVGLRFDISDQIAVDARVRYQRISGLDFERRFIAAGNDAFSAEVSDRFETVNFLAGVRYSF